MEDGRKRTRALKRILLQGPLADIDAETRPRGKRVAAIHHTHRREAHQVLPNLTSLACVYKPADLLGEEIGTRRIYVQARDPADRTLTCVRSHANSGCFGRGRYLPQRRDPTHVGDVRLQDVDD